MQLLHCIVYMEHFPVTHECDLDDLQKLRAGATRLGELLRTERAHLDAVPADLRPESVPARDGRSRGRLALLELQARFRESLERVQSDTLFGTASDAPLAMAAAVEELRLQGMCELGAACAKAACGLAHPPERDPCSLRDQCTSIDCVLTRVHPQLCRFHPCKNANCWRTHIPLGPPEVL